MYLSLFFLTAFFKSATYASNLSVTVKCMVFSIPKSNERESLYFNPKATGNSTSIVFPEYPLK